MPQKAIEEIEIFPKYGDQPDSPFRYSDGRNPQSDAISPLNPLNGDFGTDGNIIIVRVPAFGC